MWKSFKVRLTAYILGGILGVLLLLLIAVHTPPARRFVLKQAVEILAKQGIAFDAKDVEYNLFSMSASLRDVNIQSKDAPDLPRLAHADLVRLHLSLRDLVNGRLYVKDGEIDNPEIHLVIDEKGRDNLPKSKSDPNKKDSTSDYLIDYFLVKGGLVEYEDRRQKLDARLPLGQITIDGNPATNNHDVKLTTNTSGTLSYQGRTLPLRGTAADIQLQKDAVDVRSFTMGLGDSTLKFAANLKNFNDPNYDVKADTDLALGSLVDFAGVKQKVSGTVHVAVAATGPFNQLRATANITGDNVTVDKFDKLKVQAQAVYDSPAQRVHLNSFNVIAPAGTIRGKGDLALSSRAGESTLNAAVQGLDLNRVSTMLELPVQIASRATGDIAAHWPAMEFAKAEGDASLALTATRSAAARNVVPLSGNVTAKAAGRRILVGIPSLRTLNAKASGQLLLTDQKNLSGSVRIDAADLASTIQGAEALLGNKPGTLVGTPVAGSATLLAKVGGTVQSPTATAQIQSNNLQAGTLKDVQVNASVDYNASRLLIQNATAKWQGQEIAASGTVGLKGRAPALNLQATTTNVTVEALLAGLGQTGIPATGNLAVKANVAGTTKNPQAVLQISGTDVKAYSEVLGSLQADATYKGTLLDVTRLHIDKPQPGGDGTLDASGTFDTKANAYRVKADTNNIKLVALTLPDGSPLRGEVVLHAAGEGSVDNPALNLRASLNNMVYRDQQYGAANLTADVANRQANLTAEAPKFNLAAKANVGTQEPYTGTFEVTANNTDIASLPVQIDQPVTGTVSATVRGSGNIKDYEHGQASLEVAKLDLKWNNQPIRTEGPLVARYENQRLTIDRATVVALDSKLSLDGTLPLDPAAGKGAINVDGSINLASVVSYVPADQPITARGIASIKGSITGTLKSIDPNLALVLENGFVSNEALNPPVSNIQLRAQIHDGALDLQTASAEWGVASLTASGQIPFGLLPADLPVELPRKSGPAQFSADLKSLDLGTIKGLPDTLKGLVSAHLEGSAPKPDLQSLTAKLTLPQLQVSLGTYGLQQQGESTITVANGIARVDHFNLTGPATDINLAGTAALTGSQALDLRLNGNVDASIAGAFTDAVKARGATTIQAAVTGTVSNPQAEGFVQLKDAQLSYNSPRIGIDGLNARLDLAPNRITLSQVTGNINGGALSGGGSVEYSNGEIKRSDMAVKADTVYLDFPEGLKSVSNITLTAKTAAENLVLGGEVVITEAGFTDDLNIDTGVFAALGSTKGLDFTRERNPLLEKIRFDIGIRTENPIAIDNNLAKAEVSANLRLLGDPYEPGLSGTMTIEEGGRLRLNEREYTIERGNITFANERKIEPSMDIQATTKAGGYDVTLLVSGTPGKTETTLTSDPPLPEPDILAILLTGKTLDEIRGQEYEVARNQVLSYLTGRVGSKLGSGIASATGLSTVRIEPNLIANETDPSARLTVGQNITKNLGLIYSMDLVNSSDQIYVAEYDISRRFTTRGVRQSDGSFRMDFRHDVRFGGIPEPRRGKQQIQRKIGNVSILGDTYFTELKLAKQLGVKEGKKYDFFKVRKGVDKVNKLYAKENLLEANVRLKRDVKDTGIVDLTLNADKGPMLQFVYEGISVDKGEQKKVRDIWQSGVFDTQRAEEAVQSLRTWLVKDDYLRPEIEYKISTPTAGNKQVLFDIQPGPKFHKVDIVFEGSSGIADKDLEKIVKVAKLSTDIYVKPGHVTETLTRYYHEQGYLDAKVDAPKYELDKATGTGRVVFPVVEGPLFRIGNVTVEGNSVFTTAKILEELPLPKDEEFRPILRERTNEKLQQLYWAEGYNDAEFDLTVKGNKTAGTADVVVRISENRKGVIKEVVIEGNEKTSNNLISTQLEVKPGDVLNLQKVSNSRRNLYNTGAYSLVELRREELPNPSDPNEKPVRLVVNVRELQPFQIRYGGFYDTERGPGAILDVTNRNSLGSARSAGVRIRYDSQLQEFRGFFTQPLLRRFPVSTTASPFIRRERNPATADADPFNVDRIGFSVQQEAKFKKFYIFNYGYRLERTRTYDTGPDPIFDIPLRIGSLRSTLTRETRDDLLDASRGSFASQAFQWSPAVLGSQLRFIKYFGQYFRYIPLQKPKVELFTNKVTRPRLVFATGVRLGLAHGLGGQDVPLSERFFAGGGTTIRGFEQNSIGPVGAARTPLGGEGLLVINNEIRVPVIKFADAVGFVDIGNVYQRATDFSFGDIRKAAGVGLRIRTPYVLLRLDYGFKLDMKPGETQRSRLFFSIGQAF